MNNIFAYNANIMYRPTNEQVVAFNVQARENEERDSGWDRDIFVRRFLDFADRVTGNSSASGHVADNTRFMEWESRGGSKCIPMRTENGSPKMGAQIVAYRHEVKRGKNREAVIASRVTAAVVQVGPISSGPFERLVDPQPVLRVYSHPPLVLGEADPDDWAIATGELVDLTPGKEGWEGVVSFVEALTSREERLVSDFKGK
jgi:hypothetical protein